MQPVDLVALRGRNIESGGGSKGLDFGAAVTEAKSGIAEQVGQHSQRLIDLLFAQTFDRRR